MLLDPRYVEDTGLIPHGTEATAMIVSEESKSTKTGGTRLILQFQILDGRYKGENVFNSFNVVNSSDVAVRISMSGLRKIAKAVGVELSDTKLLMHKRMGVKIGIKEGRDGYDDTNEIIAWYAVKGPVGVAPTQQREKAVAQDAAKDSPTTPYATEDDDQIPF